jgi:DUF1009 family protein
MTVRMTRTDGALIQPSKGHRIALIAGSGRLPVEVAEGLERAGTPPLVIAIDGETHLPGAYDRLEQVKLPIEAFSELLPLLKRQRITHVVMAGGVSRRPPLRRIRWSVQLLRLLPRVIAALASGDNGLLSAIVGHLEANGIRVVGAHQILPDLLAQAGPMTRRRPDAAGRRDLKAAAGAALAIGRLDIGQAAVAIGGRVVAVEGIEGTDGLLDRVKDLRGHGRIAGIGGGALVKCAKPGQELRADLPTIGPLTIERVHAAGLAGIGVEAGRAFVLEFAQTMARADALGVFVVGLTELGSP